MNSTGISTDWVRPVTGIALGLLVGITIAMARESSPKAYGPALAGLLFVLLIAASKYRKEVCLLALIVAIPLPMHAFYQRLEPLHGGGAIGIYSMALEVPLLALLILWFFDWWRGNEVRKRSGLLPALLVPFLVIGGMTVLGAEKPFWGVCEWIRWGKVFLVLLYVVYRLRAGQVLLALFGLSASVLIEASLAIAQAATRSNLGMDKLGILGAGGEQALTQDLQSGTLFRGAGLTGHPNYLAGYLLLLLPIFGLLACADSGRWRKLYWTTVFLVGAGGLGATMSRAAMVSFGAGCGLALISAVVYRFIPARKAFLIAATGIVVAGSVFLVFRESIMDRIRTDWQLSWDLRSHLNHSAVSIATDHVILGVGLNNYTLAYPAYNHDFAAQLLAMDNMLTAVHNIYLLVWAETGTLGLAAFLFFLVGCMVAAFASVRKLDRIGRAVMLGFVFGLLAEMANDFTEFSLWIEICMYTLVFVAGMLPALQERAATSLLPAPCEY